MADDGFRLSENGLNDATLAPKRPPKFLPSADPKKDEILDKPLFSTTRKDTGDIIRLTSRLPVFSATEAMDCPVCSKPFPAGPERTTHFKSCSKNNVVSGSALLKLVSETKKTAKATQNNRPKALPQLMPESKAQPKVSNRSYQLINSGATSSNSVFPSTSSSLHEFRENTPQFTRITAQNEKRRKRPKSFAVVEFAPRSCQCQVLSAIQSRFLDAFKSKQSGSPLEETTFSSRTDSQAKFQRRLVEKTNLYERLADDFSSLFERGIGADVHITCNDGVIPVHRSIITARTRNFVTKEDTIRVEEPQEIVISWLRFVYTGRIEWSPGQEDVIVALAQKYGPDTLLSFRSQPKSRVKQPEEIVRRLSEPIVSTEVSKSKSPLNMIESVLNRTEEHRVSSKANEDTICGALDETNAIDGEDPMQGINISTTFDYTEVKNTNEYVIIDETRHTVLETDNATFYDEVAEEVVSQSPDVFDVTPEHLIRPELNVTAQPWHMTPFYISMNTTSSGQRSTKSEIGLSIKKRKESVQDLTFSYPFEEPLPYDDWDHVDAYQPVETSTADNAKQCLSTSKRTTSTPDGAVVDTPKSSRHRTQKSTPSKSIEVDSFDTSPHLITITPPAAKSLRVEQLSTRIISSPLATSTTNQSPMNKKLKFGSNVKILKTTAITPMPNYEAMNDSRLKIELAANGLRPMGRKRTVAKLTEIYNSIHPEIDPTTPTIRPLARNWPGVKKEHEDELKRKIPRKPIVNRPVTPIKTSSLPFQSSDASPTSDSDYLGNKTLNSETKEPAEDTILDDPASLPKNLVEMQKVFLNWLRKPENDHLYNHMLGLQPVLLEELHTKTSKADDPVCSISKKALASILDRLGATFSLPVNTRGRGGVAKRRK